MEPFIKHYIFCNNFGVKLQWKEGSNICGWLYDIFLLYFQFPPATDLALFHQSTIVVLCRLGFVIQIILLYIMHQISSAPPPPLPPRLKISLVSSIILL
jgi:hypothetical protein